MRSNILLSSLFTSLAIAAPNSLLQRQTTCSLTSIACGSSCCDLTTGNYCDYSTLSCVTVPSSTNTCSLGSIACGSDCCDLTSGYYCDYSTKTCAATPTSSGTSGGSSGGSGATPAVCGSTETACGSYLCCIDGSTTCATSSAGTPYCSSVSSSSGDSSSSSGSDSSSSSGSDSSSHHTPSTKYKKKSKSKLSSKAAAGLAIGVLVAVGFAVFAVLYLCCGCFRKKKNAGTEVPPPEQVQVDGQPSGQPPLYGAYANDKGPVGVEGKEVVNPNPHP